MADQFRVGMIGTGRIAQTYLSNWGKVEGAELAAVCDVDAGLVQSATEAYGCTGYSNYKEMIAREKLDGVVVCTPPVTHREFVTDSLESGLHVLCEKPIAISSQDLSEMYKTAGTQNRRLMMASKFRYVEDVAAARSLIKSGVLGKPVLLNNTFANWLDVRERWNSKREIGGGGVLIDNGTHSVDITRFLLGSITEVHAYEGPRVQPIEVEDTCHVSFRTESDAIGTIDLSWSIHKELDSYVDIFGTEGMLSLGWRGARYRQNHSKSWVEFGSGYDKNLAFQSQLTNFVGFCRGTEDPRITEVDAKASVYAIEAAYQSTTTGCWQKVVQD